MSTRPPSLETMPGGDDDNSGLEFFIRMVVRALILGASLDAAYQTAEKVGPDFLPLPAHASGSPEQTRTLMRAFTRKIADLTPRPEHRYALRKTPRPGRNDVCDCGSGRKYKHCCDELDHTLPFEGLNLLRFVLESLPRKRWPELAHSAIDPLAVAHTAREFLEDGGATETRALLEPWFKGERPIPAAHEPLLDTLLDTYLALGQPRKKQALLDAALAHGDRAIRSTVLQRHATIASDKGDFPGAWRYFQQAQRENAGDPSLSHLEVLLLLSEGKLELARERARFWIAKLRRLGGYDELIGLLGQMAEQGHNAFFSLHQQRWPELGELVELLAAAPHPKSLYQLTHADEKRAGALNPGPTLSRALRRWHATFPQEHPALTSLYVSAHSAWGDTAPWLSLLRKQPVLWNSFEVLDDLVLALGAIFQRGMEPLRDSLFDRADHLLRATLQAHHAIGKPLDWGWLENRPALRLLAQQVEATAAPEAKLAKMEQLIALNPNDNHGYRGQLVSAYLRQGQVEQALALTEQYADDHLPEVAFGRVLTLLALNRHEEASAELAIAHGQQPLVAPMLVAAKPRKPKASSNGFIAFGSAEQAWLHREQCLPVWQHYPGAIDWLKSALKPSARVR